MRSYWYSACFLFGLFFAASSISIAESCVTVSEWDTGGTRGDLVLRHFEIDSGDFFSLDVEYPKLYENVGKPIKVERLQLAIEELRLAYFSHGFFGVQVSACLQENANDNAADLSITVNAGKRAYVRSIEFSGIKVFGANEIAQQMHSQRRSAMSLLLEKLGYGSLQAQEDKKRIVNFYQSHGYLDAQVTNFQTKVSSDFSFCDLEITIDEGTVYRVGSIEPEEWLPNISLSKGEIFDWPRLDKDVEALLLPIKDQGFAFAKAIPTLKIDKATLSLKYVVETGHRIIIRSIIAKGADFTKEHVITREFTQLKGRLYSQSKAEAFRLNLLGRGFFSDVKIALEETEIEGLCDLVVTVVEKFPLRFNFSPRYLSGEGIILSAYVFHQNLLGNGVFALISSQLSSLRQTFELALYQPYLDGKNISWLTEIHDRQYGYLSFTSYSLGGGLRAFGRLSDLVTLGGGLALDDVSVKLNEAKSLYLPHVLVPNRNTKSSFYVAAIFQPLPLSTDVNRQLTFDARATYSGPLSLSDFNFVELAAGVRWGFSVSPFVFRGHLTGAAIFRMGRQLLPISSRYFLGGENSLRGYQVFGVGPFAKTDKDSASIQIGGVSKILQTIEAEISVMKFLDMKMYVFSDMGNSFAENTGLFDSPIAASIGLGVTAKVWRFPIKTEIAIPLADLPGALSFDFFIGLTSVVW